MPRNSFPAVTSIRGGGKFDLLPGQWTDDTSFALCIAESIIKNNGELNYIHMQDTFFEYYENNHLTSTGEWFELYPYSTFIFQIKSITTQF